MSISTPAKTKQLVKKYMGAAHYRTGDHLSIKDLTDSFNGATHFVVRPDHPAGPSIALYKEEMENDAEFMTRIKEEHRTEDIERNRRLKLYKELHEEFGPANKGSVFA